MDPLVKPEDDGLALRSAAQQERITSIKRTGTSGLKSAARPTSYLNQILQLLKMEPHFDL